MPAQPASATISFLLGYICKANHNEADTSLAAAGLHAGQDQFLSSLWEVDGLTQVELAKNMCVQPPTVNKMLSRLEAAGLVERRIDSDDNRFSRVYLTAEGRQVKHDVEQAFAQLEERVVANLS